MAANSTMPISMKRILFTIIAFATFSAPVAVAAAKGGYCIALSFTGADSVFNCEHIGKVTFRQIYEKGWRIVSYIQLRDSTTMRELIIEEQR